LKRNATKTPFLFSLLRVLLRSLPISVEIALAGGLARLASMIDRKHSAVAMANLDLAYGDEMPAQEKRRIVVRSYENLIITAMETIKAQGASREEILSRVEFENEEILLEALDSGRAIIFITAHFGNWELGALAIGARFTPIAIVGRPLDNRALDAVLRATREQFGITMIPKSRALPMMMKSLKAGTPVGVVVDQNTRTKDGLLVDFFGKEARHTPVVSILARRTDALVVPVYSFSDDYRKWRVRFYPPLEIRKSDDMQKDIEEFTQKQAEVTERVIRSKPDEWFWLHKRWKNRYEEIYR